MVALPKRSATKLKWLKQRYHFFPCNEPEEADETENVDGVTSVTYTRSGKAYQIVSWNVASILAVVRKGCWDELLKNKCDILCLQEVRCSDTQIPQELFESHFPLCVLVTWCNPMVRSGNPE